MDNQNLQGQLRLVQEAAQTRAQAHLDDLGWASFEALFEALAYNKRLTALPHRPAAHVDAALALLHYPPELGAALAERLPTLQPALRYNPFGVTMLALARLDTLAATTPLQRQRAGQLLALVLLSETPSLGWARAVYAGTPFDARIRDEVDRALRQYAPELAPHIITLNPMARPWAELDWLKRLHPAVALVFMAKYLLGVLTPPVLDAGLGAYLAHVQLGNWVVGWFWGLTAGIVVAVLLQQLRYRPMLRRLVGE